jgi:hypothetical protein
MESRRPKKFRCVVSRAWSTVVETPSSFRGQAMPLESEKDRAVAAGCWLLAAIVQWMGHGREESVVSGLSVFSTLRYYESPVIFFSSLCCYRTSSGPGPCAL